MQVSSIALFTYAAIVLCVIATGGVVVGLWSPLAAVAIGNVGWGLWLAAGYLWLLGVEE